MGSVWPILDFASHSDPGRMRLANEDCSLCDTRMNLFVVCDGLGGRPSGEAASHIIAYSLGHLIRRRLRKVAALNPQTLQAILHESAVELSDKLRDTARQFEALAGMGATLSALLIDGRQAYVLHAGDSRVFRFRAGKLRQLTTDHFRMGAPASSINPFIPDQIDQKRQRLLTQFIGVNRPLEPEVLTLQLRKGDRLLLCSDGLTDPVPDDIIAMLLAQPGDLKETCVSLIKEANARGGPDNITAVLVEYQGLKLLEPDELRRLAPPKPPRSSIPPAPGLAAKVHATLVELQNDLTWLLNGARESAGGDLLAAYAAVKRRLGPQVFHEYMKLRPSESPAHVFHRAAMLFESDWRNRYEANQAALNPNLTQIIEQHVRLCPLLTGEETSEILETLWREWTKVEGRYNAICHQETFDPTDHALDRMIEHMHGSVGTLIGLMEFFPKFMRESSGETAITTAQDI